MNKDTLVIELERHLRALAAEREAARRDPALQAARTAVKRYQAARLAATHPDLLAAPDTREAAAFFLNDIYGAHNLGQREADLERIVPSLQRLLPLESLHTITGAIALDALTEKLDTGMARVLGAEVDEAAYLMAYRSASAPQDRARQLELVQQLGDSLCSLVRIPLLSLTLSVMRGPARLAGVSELHQFLDRGFSSFKKMKKPAHFVDTIVGRERRAMGHIYAGRKEPFDVF
ncbi:FFLEELY motif protein [Massilia genomosp. 1]|uniref:DUF8198 domain-containing protein n=1 Tax=Massilia genomosp. 1 TaxID=2609280 RepID=A0ABX0MNS8_9BURK|nr:hypothetical protein [Massilia genomosp. 1]NHZ61595.1 hypothetical protein [Massilia genomosp. 1]